MSEKISVAPTPIQRNSMDVAMELVNLHLRRETVDTSELSKLYAKYFTVAETLSRKHVSDLAEFLPEEIKSKFTK